MIRCQAAVEDGRITIRTAATASHDEFHDALQLCREVPGRRWDPDRKAWTAPATAETARRIAAIFASPHSLEADAEVRALIERKDLGGAEVRAADFPDIPGAKTKPWRHQLQAYWFCRQRPGALLNMGMGTGKSKVVVDLVCSVHPPRVLILCPKSVLDVWPRMFGDHGGEDCDVLMLNQPTAPKKCDALMRHLAVRSDPILQAKPRVVVCNYEAARSGFSTNERQRPSKGLSADLLRQRWSLVVLDESHRCKDSRSLTSRFVAQLRDTAMWRICLTGTPMPHSPLDIFSQAQFLDPAIFGHSFVKFRARYATMRPLGNTGIQTVDMTKFKNQDEMARLMDRFTFTAKTDDVLDLPPATEALRTYVLSPEERRLYDEMEATFVAAIREGTVTAANALVRLLRLQQITSGFLPDPEGERAVQIGRSKELVLAEVLEEIGVTEPAAVFARFHADLDAVARCAAAEFPPSQYVELSGRRNDIAKTGGKWEHGLRLGVQIQSGGVGVDLTRARYAIYYSVGYSLGDYLQSQARIRRPGQTRPVTYVHLQARDTIDEIVREALVRKRDVVDYVLEQLR